MFVRGDSVMVSTHDQLLSLRRRSSLLPEFAVDMYVRSAYSVLAVRVQVVTSLGQIARFARRAVIVGRQ